ncbi:MAG: DUF1828 domain-containing protein [Desulfobacterales bacterium]|nr:DUF1828 domain-containing protein [Desulfobacterales bacterium]
MQGYLEQLKAQFNERIRIVEKRPGIHQIIAPIFHEDGDLMDIYIEKSTSPGMLRISDHAMTLMRLSYDMEIDTPNKERVFKNILLENKLSEENGRLFIDTKEESLYPAMMQFTQAVAKVSNMRVLKREVVKGLFYEMLEDYIENKLAKYNPVKSVTPINDRAELEVDYLIETNKKKLFLLGVKDNAKARIATISFLEFQKAKISFCGVVVHDDFEALSRKDRSMITSAADKQFVSFADFQEKGPAFIEREAA